MRDILKQRPLRLIFGANMVSMLGSGMNTAAVTWYILQATHSEMSLGWLMTIQTVPALLMLPFTGAIIDREDRRHLVMFLDAVRGVIILGVAFLALSGRVHIWQLYLMNTLVAAGFWMFWPTVTALIQELTPHDHVVSSSSLLLAGVQSGWLLAGAVVGFVYNHIGLAGILFIDAGTYVVSLLMYLSVRSGRTVVARTGPSTAPPGLGAAALYFHELREGVDYLAKEPAVVVVGISWAFFIGAMLTQGVITAPLSDRVLHAGAVGYGWLNAGWGVGAFFGAIVTGTLLGITSVRWVPVSLGILGTCLLMAPFSGHITLAVLLFVIMGTARGIAGVGISAEMMSAVPKHFMGRVQNTFYFAGTLLQLFLGLTVAAAAHTIGLAAAFAIVGGIYLFAALAALWPLKKPPLSSQSAPG